MPIYSSRCVHKIADSGDTATDIGPDAWALASASGFLPYEPTE